MSKSRSTSPIDARKKHGKTHKRSKERDRKASRHRSRSRDNKDRKSRRRSPHESSRPAKYYRRATRSPSEERVDMFGRALSKRSALEDKKRKEDEELKSAIERQRMM